MARFERIVLVFLILTAIGCGSNSASVQSRLASDLQVLHKSTATGADQNWFTTTVNRDLLDDLTNISPRDLRNPHLIVPILGVKSNDAVLAVLWAEDKPSVTGIELRSHSGESHELEIPVAYRIENMENSKRSVVFRAVYRWQRGEMPPHLKSACEVRLIAPSASTNFIALVIREMK